MLSTYILTEIHDVHCNNDAVEIKVNQRNISQSQAQKRNECKTNKRKLVIRFVTNSKYDTVYMSKTQVLFQEHGKQQQYCTNHHIIVNL